MIPFILAVGKAIAQSPHSTPTAVK